MVGIVRINEDALSPDSLFSGNLGLLFEIHPPQRRYKWKAQQIDQLWQDIVKAHEAARDSYFLGSLLLVPLSGGQMSVIDGQQRITTLSLLLAVLRDQCRTFDLVPRASRIQQLISRVDNDGNPLGPLVIKLQEPDNQTYINLVNKYGSTELIPSNRDPLVSAARTLKDHVTKYLADGNETNKLRALCEYIQTKVKLLPLLVPTEGEGYLVFDTTNTRGLRLSPAEALKARLAAIARDNPELSNSLIQKWNSAATKLETNGLRIDGMDDYLHVVWCSKHGHTLKRTLDQVASKFSDKYGLQDFVEDLDAYTDSYLAVVAPSGKPSLNEDLKDLRGLNVQSSGLLTMVHKHAPSRFEEAVDLVLSLQIRNITIGPLQANEYETSWPNWSYMVRNGEVVQVFEEIRNHMVPDEDFKKSFAQAVVPSSVTVRHVLRRLDPISRAGSGVQPTEVEVEHILPKSVVNKLKNPKSEITLPPNDTQWLEDLGKQMPHWAPVRRIQ